jgi:cellulose biosynthesis protein BcsQ
MVQEVRQKLEKYFRNKLMSQVIHEADEVAISPSHGKVLREHAPASEGAREFKALVDEFLKGDLNEQYKTHFGA